MVVWKFFGCGALRGWSFYSSAGPVCEVAMSAGSWKLENQVIVRKLTPFSVPL